jgi:hypothetical protein
MHHLVVLAYAYILARDGVTGFQPAEQYAIEYRNQLIDFIAQNPPRRGINWACSMDVGIRIANWLIAYDLFRAGGYHFDRQFDEVFCRSVYEHARHCITNLEEYPIKGNHYLADIAGVLFAAAFLPRDPEIDGWLAFAVQELATEVKAQFHSDGSNFEGATCYHALSLDIALHSAVLCLLLGEDKREALIACDGNRRVHPRMKRLSSVGVDVQRRELFDELFWQRLRNAVQFITDIRRSDGTLPQFGDNDSGRFLKLWPTFDRMTPASAIARYRQLTNWSCGNLSEYWDEVVLDYNALCVVGELLFDRADLASTRPPPLRLLLARILERSPAVPVIRRCGCPALASASTTVSATQVDLELLIEDLVRRHGEPIVTEFVVEIGRPLTDGLSVRSYFGMGLFVFRSRRLYLAVRCGEVGQLGNGGHAHNDQLTIELVLDEQNLVRDPGTYTYTSSVDIRNRFRSTAMHFTPRVGDQEQNTWHPGQRGLFGMIRAVGGRCTHISDRGFAGSHHAFDRPVSRVIEIRTDRVRISDFGAESPGMVPTVFSNGYGRWLR